MAKDTTHRPRWYDLSQPRADRRWRGERPWPAVAPPPGETDDHEHWHHEKSTISMRLFRHELALILAGGVIVVLLALVLAAALFREVGGAALILTTVLLAVYIVLLTAPVWIAALLDDAEDHADELKDPAGTGSDE